MRLAHNKHENLGTQLAIHWIVDFVLFGMDYVVKALWATDVAMVKSYTTPCDWLRRMMQMHTQLLKMLRRNGKLSQLRARVRGLFVRKKLTRDRYECLNAASVSNIEFPLDVESEIEHERPSTSESFRILRNLPLHF